MRELADTIGNVAGFGLGALTTIVVYSLFILVMPEFMAFLMTTMAMIIVWLGLDWILGEIRGE